VVPSLRGKTLVAAKRTLLLRHCALGRVGHAYTHRAGRGRVAFQSAPAGEHRGRNAQIDLVVSRGKR
jgi:beta-lactam-binding protein with PASTA domain